MITSILAGIVLASAPQATNSPKIDAIWNAAEDRILMQEDAWFDDGEFPMVVQLLEFHAEIEPHDYEVATNLGWMHENIEQWDDATFVYQQYFINNPSDPDRALPEGEYLYRRKKFAEVIPLVEKNLFDKSHPNLFRILAHSYEKENRLQDAEKVWERYLALAPDDLQAKKNLQSVKDKIAKGTK